MNTTCVVVEAFSDMLHNESMHKNFDEKEYQNFLILLGQNVRNVRESAKLSQEQLAFGFESARNYIGCVERAEKTPSLKTLFKIAKVLNVRVEDLLKDTMQ